MLEYYVGIDSTVKSALDKIAKEKDFGATQVLRFKKNTCNKTNSTAVRTTLGRKSKYHGIEFLIQSFGQFFEWLNLLLKGHE